MRCKFCKKESEETHLFEGIFAHEMIRVCGPCAEMEGIPIMKKPSTEQLDRAETSYTVRERMEKISGMHERNAKKDELRMQGDIAKLKMPPKRQYHEDLLDDYSWTLNLARRRAKMSLKQLAEEVHVSEYTLQEIEKGQIPKDFEEIFLKLEAFLKIKLLKNHKPMITFTQKKDDEQEILRNVREKMQNQPDKDSPEEVEHREELLERKKEKLAKLNSEKNKFSNEKDQKDLENITLSDLVELKRKREQKESEHKKRIQTDAMIGDDIELDEL